MIITGSAHPRESSEIKVEVEEEKPKEEAEIGTQRGRGGECGSPNMRDPELPAEPGAVEPGRTLGAAAPGVRLDPAPGSRGETQMMGITSHEWKAPDMRQEDSSHSGRRPVGQERQKTERKRKRSGRGGRGKERQREKGLGA